MLSVIYPEYHYAECHYAECRGAITPALLALPKIHKEPNPICVISAKVAKASTVMTLSMAYSPLFSTINFVNVNILLTEMSRLDCKYFLHIRTHQLIRTKGKLHSKMLCKLGPGSHLSEGVCYKTFFFVTDAYG
jgi:hypothetical protein